MNRCHLNVLPHLFIILSSLFLPSSAQAAQWRMMVGGHDFIVYQANSHTLGSGIGISFADTTESDISLFGRFNTYFDFDIDELDPDHIPIWFQSDFVAEGELVRLTETASISWFVEAFDKRNTVSSVEQQQKLMPGFDFSINGQRYKIGTKASAGYYALEIDDDVPKSRGYSRGDLRNSTSALSLQLYATVAFSEKAGVNLSAQQWHDGDDWLENQYHLTLNYDAADWITDSLLVIDIIHTEYNLDSYNDPQKLPILPWDRDTFVRVFLEYPLN